MLATEPLRLREQAFVLLRDLIHEKTGIYLGDGKKYLVENRLGGRVSAKGFGCFEEYYQYIKRSSDSKEENALFETITTNETYFYRDSPQLEYFSGRVIPAIRSAAAGGGRFRIWSAGCSTGEEPYTLAIMALNAVPGLKRYQLEVVGTDISHECLSQAKLGRFNSYAVRNIPDVLLRRYFTKRDEWYVVNREVRELVRFERVNLADGAAMRRIRNVNLVFCKNVFIYFSGEVRRRVAEGFHGSLVPGGSLVLGSSEYLKDCDSLFTSHKLGQCVYYRKP